MKDQFIWFYMRKVADESIAIVPRMFRDSAGDIFASHPHRASGEPRFGDPKKPLAESSQSPVQVRS
jgi:hypothetical protein